MSVKGEEGKINYNCKLLEPIMVCGKNSWIVL